MQIDDISFVFKNIHDNIWRVTLHYKGKDGLEKSMQTVFRCKYPDVKKAFLEYIDEAAELGTFAEFCEMYGKNPTERASIRSYQEMMSFRDDFLHMLGISEFPSSVKNIG